VIGSTTTLQLTLAVSVRKFLAKNSTIPLFLILSTQPELALYEFFLYSSDEKRLGNKKPFADIIGSKTKLEGA